MRSDSDLLGSAPVSGAVFGVPPNTLVADLGRHSVRRDAERCDRDGRDSQPTRAAYRSRQLRCVCPGRGTNELALLEDYFMLWLQSA